MYNIIYSLSLQVLTFVYIFSPSTKIKYRFPTTVNLLPSDHDVINAILDFIEYQEWYYFSVIYQTEYFDVYRIFKQDLDEHIALCLSRKVEVNLMTNSNFTQIITDILEDNFGSKIILILGGLNFSKLFVRDVNALKADGKLLFISYGAWLHLLWFGVAPKSSLIFSSSTFIDSQIKDHIRSLDKNSANPWFLKSFEDLYNCSFSACGKEYLTAHANSDQFFLPVAVDAVNVLAYALHDFLANYCPKELGPGAVACFRKQASYFTKFLVAASLKGLTGDIRFDESGRVLEDVYVLQPNSEHLERPLVAANVQLNNHSYMRTAIDWSQFVFSWKRLESDYFCTVPCGPLEYRQSVSRCCWICRPCPDGKKPSTDGMICEICPQFYWPRVDPKNNSSICERVRPEKFTLNSMVAGCMLSAAGLGALLDFIASYLYYRHRKHSIIKASSLELSFVQLLAMLLGYCAIPMGFHEPTTTICCLFFLLNNISTNTLYLTMLMKAIRVYRIFQKGTDQIKVKFTSPFVQVLICGVFLCFEVVKFFIINHHYPIKLIVYQPERLEKYVELACDFPRAHLLPFCVFDLLLIFLCSVFAFKTQNLPNNFKESRFVSMCVMTSLIVWAVLLPSFMATTSKLMKTLYLALAIIINHTTAMLFLFFSRLLALRFLSDRRRSSMFQGPPSNHFIC